jgi:hypothetical protein
MQIVTNVIDISEYNTWDNWMDTYNNNISARDISDTFAEYPMDEYTKEIAYNHVDIGTELVRRCVEHYPGSEWLVETKDAAYFYSKIGFKNKVDDGYVHLYIPSKLF